jgi:hypothetical protein
MYKIGHFNFQLHYLNLNFLYFDIDLNQLVEIINQLLLKIVNHIYFIFDHLIHKVFIIIIINIVHPRVVLLMIFIFSLFFYHLFLNIVVNLYFFIFG